MKVKQVLGVVLIISIHVQGRMKEGKRMFAPFLDLQKAYDTVWRSGL